MIRKQHVKSALLTAILVVSMLVTNQSWARPTRASANTFHLGIDPYAYVVTNGSQTLQPWRYHFSLFFDYARNPLEIGVAGARRQGIVDNLITANLTGVLGITDWFQVGLDVPVAIYEDWTDPVTAIREKTLRMSDVRLDTKFRLVDNEKHIVGVALMPYMFFPTGSGSRFVGSNSFSGGAKAVVDFKIKERVQIATNLGYLIRDRVTILGTLQDDSFTYGLGLKVKASDVIDVIADVYGATPTDNFFSRAQESPLEADAALKFNLRNPEGLAITVGGGTGLTYGYGAPDIRAFVGLSYPNPTRVDLPTPPPPAPEPIAHVEKEKIVIMKKVHFEFDKAVIRPVSFRILDAVVEVLQQNPDVQVVNVEGHTDSKGSDEYNDKLSVRRANAVRDYLIAHGIQGSRLKSVGYGETKPIADNETDEGRAKNRRVEFIIVDQDGVVSASN